MWLTAAVVILAAVGIWTGSLIASAGQPHTGSTQIRTASVAAGQQGAPAQPKSFIGSLADAGYKDLTVDQLIAFKIHDVTPDFIEALRKAGLTGLTPDELLAFRIHGATPEFVRSLKDVGVTTLSGDDVIAARIHGITAEFIKEAVKMGIKDLTIDRLVQLKLSKIPPSGKL
jgi:hypothetical protein